MTGGSCRKPASFPGPRPWKRIEKSCKGRIDPALLEYAGGNTFSGRVFPIPAKGFNRVIFAYEELLLCSQDQAAYRFPCPTRSWPICQFSLSADGNEDAKSRFFLPAGQSDVTGRNELRYHREWTEKGPGGEVIFLGTDWQTRASRVISGRQG